MGLDQQIYKSKAQFSCEKDDFIGEELIYFRKFYSLNIWIVSKCEKLYHDWLDVFKVTREDLEKFTSSVKNNLEEMFQHGDSIEKLNSLENFIKTLPENTEEIYYYTYIN